MKLAVVLIILLGLVDQVEDDYALAEITFSDGSVETIEFPVAIFPCEIAEGDYFYISAGNDVTEIHCGKPPEEI
jgi:hypothetical protein